MLSDIIQNFKSFESKFGCPKYFYHSIWAFASKIVDKNWKNKSWLEKAAGNNNYKN